MGRCKLHAVRHQSHAPQDTQLAHFFSSMANEANSRWERRTWPELKRLATHAPESGIHFQSRRTSLNVSIKIPEVDSA